MRIKDHIQILLNEIQETAFKFNRNAEDIKLIAVSKTFSETDIIQAYDSGLICFAENKVQEAIQKIEALNQYPLEWHLVGHLQSNKVKKAVASFQMIQSIDKISTLSKVNEHAGMIDKKQNILIQVNTSKEESKFGINPEILNEFIKQCEQFPNVNIAGLMTIGPFTEDIIKIKNSFYLLKELFETARIKYSQTDFKYLSMGMTDDFKIAIECGSNMLRIGRKIFGQRSYT